MPYKQELIPVTRLVLENLLGVALRFMPNDVGMLTTQEGYAIKKVAMVLDELDQASTDTTTLRGIE